MALNCFNRFVLESPRRLGMPIAVYPGIALTGATVANIVTDSQAQFAAQLALYERFRAPFVMSAMDLSAEAEAFGCTLQVSENEIPSVTGRLVTTLEQAQRLAVPTPGDKRTAVYLETVRHLRGLPDKLLVFGGCIGPFSLAARLVGVSEAMEMTVTEPDLVRVLLEKCTSFLTAYLREFRRAGADGVIMAEPAAGLLSPRSMSEFSSSYVKQIGGAMADGHFAIILHNCGAKAVHLPAILATDLNSFHFGPPMDVAAALARVPADVVLCGNLDPAGVFLRLPPREIMARAEELLKTVADHPNFVLSSGCDIPAAAPLDGLDAFYAAMRHAARADGNRR